ncbi:unnamed protein product, partial [Rhizoctonia solani]
ITPLLPQYNCTNSSTSPGYTLAAPDDAGDAKTRNIVIGAMIGGMSLIALTYLIVFLYLRKHGRTFDDILLQRRRGVTRGSHHRQHDHPGHRSNDPAYPLYQRSGSYNPNAPTGNQIPRTPEPTNVESNWRP